MFLYGIVGLILILAAGGIGYKIGFADGIYTSKKKENQDKLSSDPKSN